MNLFLEGVKMFLSSFVGTLGFAFLLQAPRKSWIPASIIGGTAYTFYWVLAQCGTGENFAIFVSSLLGSLLAQGCARRMRMIATIFVTLAIIAQVPGLGLYRCMALLGQQQHAMAAQVGVSAMMSILMMALGLAVGSFTFRLIMTLKKAAAEQYGRRFG